MVTNHNKQKMMHKISPQSNKNQKKVHFDSARVSFQVEYDVPDDRSLRTRIPIWTEHWKKSKSGLLLQLMRALSVYQWFKLFFTLLFVSLLCVQLLQTVDQYLKRETLITADYSLPSPHHMSWPSVSLCVPIVIPFCNQSCSVQRLFNQSLSVFHRCKHVTKEERGRLCSPPLQWIHRSRKCFTYSTEDSELQRLELFIQSSEEQRIQLFVHQKHAFPLDENTFPSIHLKQSTDLQITFFKTTLVSSEDPKSECEDYKSPLISFGDCFSRCLFSSCGKHCVSRLAPIRSDLLTSNEFFCPLKDDCLLREEECLNVCPEDCEKTSFHLSLNEQQSRDQSEQNVSITRQVTPDLLLTHIPRVTRLTLVSQLGGLCAFWMTLLWLTCRLVHVFSLLNEVLEIYFS